MCCPPQYLSKINMDERVPERLPFSPSGVMQLGLAGNEELIGRHE
jgi:hypothetical protein